MKQSDREIYKAIEACEVELICVSENSVTFHFGNNYINILNDFIYIDDLDRTINRIPYIDKSVFSIIGSLLCSVVVSEDRLMIKLNNNKTIEMTLSPYHENIDLYIDGGDRKIY